MYNGTTTLGIKRTKREKNSIIIHFIFYFILTVGLLILIFTTIIPKIIQIEKDKTLTKEIYNSIIKIEKYGLDFNEFKKIASISKNNKIVSVILGNMKENFYDENLVNNTNYTYTDFLQEKNSEINSIDNIEIVDNKTKQISRILPSYSITPIDLQGDLLTDYKFINYIESLIETFGLSTDSSIGIKKLGIVEDYSINESKGSTLDSNLYYIPLNLSLKGDKKGIINFLYYIENVGNIIVDNEKIKLNKDYGFLYKNGRKIVLEGEQNTPDYNIFEHQIIDIEKISMDNYLDSSYIDKNRGENDFKTFIIKNQGYDDFEIKVNLLFYVKGQPAYKTEEFINNIFNKQKKALSIINLKLKDTKTEEIERRKLMKHKTTLNQMNKEISDIKNNLIKNEKLDELYNSAIKLNTIIEPIFNSLN